MSLTLVSCAEESEAMKLFRRSVSVETQLAELRSCGIELNEGVEIGDLTTFDDRAALEKRPYQGLVEVLGIDVEREPFTPICDSLWMCDYERVEDHGAYAEVLERLELMTGSALGLSDIEDHVDVFDEGVAWVSFTFGGQPHRWDFEVQDDWLDPTVFVKYDQMLKAAESEVRIYSNHTDYGQVAFLAAFSASQHRCFEKLSPVKLMQIEYQA